MHGTSQSSGWLDGWLVFKWSATIGADQLATSVA